MKKIIIALAFGLTTLGALALEPEQIRREFSGNLKQIQQTLPRKIADGFFWKSIDYKPKQSMVVLTYQTANHQEPLDAETARQFYEQNLAALSKAYAEKSDPLVGYAVDGDLTMRFVYLTSDGKEIATLDYSPSALKP